MGSRTTISYSHDSSGSSSICYFSRKIISQQTSDPGIPALRRPIESLRSRLQTSDFNLNSDAKFVVSGNLEIPVDRRILSSRSPFFKNLFSTVGEERGWKFEMKELAKDLEVGYDSLVAVLDYLYSEKLNPLPEGVCICVDNDCEHIGCLPKVNFMVEVLYASFSFQIPELVSLYQNRLLSILEKVAIDDILVILSVANICSLVCDKLLKKCTEIIFKSDIDVVTLEKALPYDIVKKIMDSRLELGLGEPGINNFPDKHVKRIHRALDSDDVDLVKMLLNGENTKLDDSYALHYAVAYSDPKTLTELLDLGLVDVNCKNRRGYTALHVAAMRKEPKILVSLLTKGARPSDLTPDGRKALQILKRLSRFVDDNRSSEEGKASVKDRLCIEILEQAEKIDPLLGEISFSLEMEGNNMRMELLCFKNRDGLAKLLFPVETKSAIDNAQKDGILEVPLSVNSQSSRADPNTPMNLNDLPFEIKEESLSRMNALSTKGEAELEKGHFSHCSMVFDMMANSENLSELAYIENDNTEERLSKKKRYTKLQDILSTAFSKDIEEFDGSFNFHGRNAVKKNGDDKS